MSDRSRRWGPSLPTWCAIGTRQGIYKRAKPPLGRDQALRWRDPAPSLARSKPQSGCVYCTATLAPVYTRYLRVGHTRTNFTPVREQRNPGLGIQHPLNLRGTSRPQPVPNHNRIWRFEGLQPITVDQAEILRTRIRRITTKHAVPNRPPHLRCRIFKIHLRNLGNEFAMAGQPNRQSLPEQQQPILWPQEQPWHKVRLGELTHAIGFELPQRLPTIELMRILDRGVPHPQNAFRKSAENISHDPNYGPDATRG